MCLALIVISEHPQYPIIILSNRDEFYQRASVSAHFWPDYPNIFAGRDSVAQGTWLGINKEGGLALVTNYRNPKKQSNLKLSRGLLVSHYLLEKGYNSPFEYIKKIASMATDYNQFNLIVGNLNEIYYYSNVTHQAQKLAAGIHCISNHLLNTPWYKVERAKALFSQIKNEFLNCTERNKMRDLLFPILADKQLAPDDLLPDTGVGVDIEKMLSSIFVNLSDRKYGTRSSSVILFEQGNISFSEKIYNNGQCTSLTTTNIKLFRGK